MNEYMNDVDLVLDMKRTYADMSQVDKKLADFFISNIDEIPNKTVTEISEICQVSEASIIRFAKKMGFSGFYQMKIELAKSSKQNIIFGGYDTEPNSTEAIIQRALDIAVTNISNSLRNIYKEDLLTAVEMIKKSKNIIFFAAGNSYPPCKDFIYKLSRIGIRGSMSEIPERALMQARNMEKGDLVIALSHSGDSSLVNTALKIVKEKDIPVIGITNYRKSPIMKWVNIAIVTAIQHNMFTGSEGLTRITEVAVFDLLFYLLFYADKEANSRFISQTEFDQSQYSL